jgi:hypothetical protein
MLPKRGFTHHFPPCLREGVLSLPSLSDLFGSCSSRSRNGFTVTNVGFLAFSPLVWVSVVPRKHPAHSLKRLVSIGTASRARQFAIVEK